MQSTKGSIRLFHLAGIDVFLHWSWFFVAALEISMRGRRYPSIAWNIAEYLTLFLIVTLHEFGHALACRQVGGTANRIMLWPLGGVAYVNPPPTGRRYTLEHRGGADGECGAGAGLVGTSHIEPIVGVVGGAAQCLP